MCVCAGLVRPCGDLCVCDRCVVAGYDAALYSAATSYYQQQQQQQQVQAPRSAGSISASSWQPKKVFTQKMSRPKLPPKQPQLHYCEVCKISCAGPQVRAGAGASGGGRVGGGRRRGGVRGH